MELIRTDALPQDLHSRVMAATANASHRRVIQHGVEGAGAHYTVEAISGDQLTLMQLSLGPNQSVNEETETFTTRDIVDLDLERSQVAVQGPEGIRALTVLPDTAKAIRALR